MSESPPRKRKFQKDPSSVLEKFIPWCEKGKIEFSPKVQVSSTGTSHGFGMLAKENISKNEVLFKIPRAIMLWENNCSQSESTLISIESKSGWVSLLLTLMLEYSNDNSRWKPYLDFLPSKETLDLALFWSASERKRILGGTSMYNAVERDVTGLEKEYSEIALPFMTKNKHLGFDPEIHSLELFKHMTGWVMAYSFTEPIDEGEEEIERRNPPKMVPVADVLNHVAKHNAELNFEEENLEMLASRDIAVGSEIFNTYGPLPNCSLLQMYGFVEEYPNNINDVVEIPLDHFKKAVEVPLLSKKWSFLFGDPSEESPAILEGCEGVTITMDSIQSYEELQLMLQILVMPQGKFSELVHDKGFREFSPDLYSECPFTEIKKNFSEEQCSILRQAAKSYHEHLERMHEEKKKLCVPEHNISRKNNILTFLHAHMSILNDLTQYL